MLYVTPRTTALKDVSDTAVSPRTGIAALSVSLIPVKTALVVKESSLLLPEKIPAYV